MTQAYNLAILANAVDTSGRLNVGTNATGVLPVANGGTGTATPSLVAGTNISITGTFPNQTITNTQSASGTVTSVATGNGLSGGTITTSGTLTVACPSFNSVGSYCWGSITSGSNGTLFQGGSNYSAGSGTNQVQSGGFYNQNLGEGAYGAGPIFQNNLSGTWKYMGANNTVNNGDRASTLFCRVS